MTALRASLLVLFTVALLMGGCAGTAGLPSPTPIGGTVDTPEEAIAAVVATEPRFTGITPQDPGMIGQSAWYEVVPASGVGAYLVHVQVGWGDCPAGCINRHTWTYAVLPDGTVNLQSEAGDPVPADAWPQPIGTGQTGIVGIATGGPTCPVET
ncbi:MAG: hypothetical protein MUP13_00445, partial [Thermoanaerobaculales bacterium]|nr:hypothetical protein [Thermoanaerobaculales bacterium]